MQQKTKSLLQIVAISIFYTALLVALFSGALYLYNGLILFNILFTTGAILSIGYLFNLFTIQRFNRFVAEKQIEIFKEEQKQYLNIECCECGRVANIKLDLQNDMTFECEDCKVTNKVFYVFKAGRPTEVPQATNVVEMIDKFVAE